ncbi:hypothetical protein LCGC14_2242180, partial [marine sediment metagenome]
TIPQNKKFQYYYKFHQQKSHKQYLYQKLYLYSLSDQQYHKYCLHYMLLNFLLLN